MAYMLSRDRYQEEIEDSVDNAEELDFFKTDLATTERNSEGTYSMFNEDEYEGD